MSQKPKKQRGSSQQETEVLLPPKPAPDWKVSEWVIQYLKRREALLQQDPQAAYREYMEDWNRILQVVYEGLKNKGFQTELEEWPRLVHSALKGDKTQRKQARLRLLSLSGLWLFLEDGETAALLMLPLMFQENFLFFHKERWIEDLLAQWHQRGEQDKFQQAFFGPRTGKRGIRKYGTTIENIPRNRKIAAEVERLLKQGVGYNEAIQQVSHLLPNWDIKDRLSPSAIRKIFEDHRTGNSALFRLITLLLPEGK